MDQHPIPQDVTGFQFKLIGTMTVKQFGYVACGVVSAVILYYLPIQSAFAVLAKVILVPLFGASGVIIAFVPLEGRPIDVMATNFIKALFSPNQYIYHRQGKKLSFSTVSVTKAPAPTKTNGKQVNHVQTPAEHHDEKGEKLRALLMSSHSQTKSAIDKKEAAFLNTLALPAVPPTQPAQPIPPPKPAIIVSKFKLPTHAVVPESAQIAAINKYVQPVTNAPMPAPTPAPIENEPKAAPVTTTPNPINSPPPVVTPPPQQPVEPEHKVTMLSQQINEIHAQKQQLEQELSHLKNQLATHKTVPAVAPMPTPAQAPTQPGQPLQDPQHVRTIPQNVLQKVGLPHVSDSPNVVVGIVKDPRGNILPNILVEIKDKDNNPVRAFKTNQLGQFASATSLSPGIYTMELDDPKKQHRFDIIQVTANNTVLLPIEVISHDAREELRKQLFAN